VLLAAYPTTPFAFVAERCWPDSPGELTGAPRARAADSGVAGTEIRYPFFAGTACWLARRYGDRLRIDWPRRAPRRGRRDAARAASSDETLERLLVDHHAETPGLTIDRLRGWLARMADAAPTRRRRARGRARRLRRGQGVPYERRDVVV
jgi:hypothetical protein